MDQIIKMSNIHKHFGSTKALNGVDFHLFPGEIVGLLGENGAGKTTLMNVLYGLVEADKGNIHFFGKEINIHSHSPAQSLKFGLSMVHQHFMLVNRLTVAENLIIGKEPTKFGFTDINKAVEDVRRLVDKFNLQVDPDDIVGNLSVSQRQRLEILRALYHESKILILDEPTAVLAPSEVDSLFQIVENLRNNGMCVVLIAHKLEEVLRICGRIYILRKGKLIAETNSNDTDKLTISKMMVGESYEEYKRHPESINVNYDGSSIFEIRNLKVRDDFESERVKGINLKVFPGEIVSIAGVAGNGQDYLERALIGLLGITNGNILLNGIDISSYSIEKRREKGLGYIPQDRHEYGLVSEFTIRDNLILGRHRLDRYNNFGVLNINGIQETAKNEIQEFNIDCKSINMKVKNLSGGNQQKVVLARAVSGDLKILLASQISRGLDVSAVASIYRYIRSLCQKGIGILLFSFDLDEVLELSDRIYVMRKGELIGPLEREKVDYDLLGQLITMSELSIDTEEAIKYEAE